MVDYNTFETFEVDPNKAFIEVIDNNAGYAEFLAPRTAFFTTPPLSNGDTFHFHQALEAAPIPDIEVVSSFSGVTKEVVQRVAVMQAYIEDDAVTGITGVAVLPGNPPRYRFGSYTESVNGVVTKYGSLNYRRQAFGQRLLLLDRDFSQWVYGVQTLIDPEVIERYDFQEFLLYMEHCHSISLYLESSILFDENAGSDPPLPPSIVPLTFTIYGQVVFDFTGIYTYPFEQSEGTTTLVKIIRAGLTRRMAPPGVGWGGGAFPL